MRGKLEGPHLVISAMASFLLEIKDHSQIDPKENSIPLVDSRDTRITEGKEATSIIHRDLAEIHPEEVHISTETSEEEVHNQSDQPKETFMETRRTNLK